MDLVTNVVRRAAPAPAKRAFRSFHREYVFRRAVARFARIERAEDLEPVLLSELVYGWGNQWAADEEYLEAVLHAAWTADGPILECGSGLTTLLVGMIAARTGQRLYSLEHIPFWADKIGRLLERYDVRSAYVDVAPLREGDEYAWYAPTARVMAERFALVICDGPPESTRGGRYGLMPVMRSRLASGCRILVDDVHRPKDAAVLDRWAQELDVVPERLGRGGTFACLLVP